jgi:hypothetical protein
MSLMTNSVTAMPIKSACIALDEIGYAGWQAELRLNVAHARTTIF